jgi:hypothetical protein
LIRAAEDGILSKVDTNCDELVLSGQDAWTVASIIGSATCDLDGARKDLLEIKDSLWRVHGEKDDAETTTKRCGKRGAA